MLAKKTGWHMKTLSVILILITLSACKNVHFFPKGYGPELAYKCQTDPYSPDCLQPPPVLKSPWIDKPLANDGKKWQLKPPFKKLHTIRQLLHQPVLWLWNSTRNEPETGPARIACALIINDQIPIILNNHTGVIPKWFIPCMRTFSNGHKENRYY